MAEPDLQAVEDKVLELYGSLITFLAENHARLGKVTSGDLSASESWNACWKMSGYILGLQNAVMALLQARLVRQAWPMFRAVHEAHRLLAAMLADEAFAQKWLADREIKQSEARKVEEAHALEMQVHMRDAGIEIEGDIGSATRELYGRLSDGAHHRRSVVDEAVNHEARILAYGPEPDPRKRMTSVAYAGSLLYETGLHVGDALGQMIKSASLYEGPFFIEEVKPQLDVLQEATTGFEMITRLYALHPQPSSEEPPTT